MRRSQLFEDLYLKKNQAEKKLYSNEKGSVTYLNSGDWVESLTALEYNDKSWSIYQFREDQSAEIHDEESFINLASKLDVKSLYNSLIAKAAASFYFSS